jgi:hypothetical protein
MLFNSATRNLASGSSHWSSSSEERVLTVAGERSSMQDDVLAVIGAQPDADIMTDCMQVVDTALERTADEQAREAASARVAPNDVEVIDPR